MKYLIRLFNKQWLLLFVLVIAGSQNEKPNTLDSSQGNIDSINTSMQMDSVVEKLIKPIPVDSLREMIEADTNLSGNMKSMLDSLLKSADNDSL